MTSEPALAVRQSTRRVIEQVGWVPGSSLENRVALQLWRWGFDPSEVKQQLRVLSYRLDFAWPDLLVALEVDGPRHIFDPTTARRDAERDSRLRAEGWLVFRIDDEGTEERALADQLCRVVQVVRMMNPRAGSRRRS